MSRKKIVVQFRCTQEEIDLWSREANKISMSLSGYIRKKLNEPKKRSK